LFGNNNKNQIILCLSGALYNPSIEIYDSPTVFSFYRKVDADRMTGIIR
jgi:hypothetical protein